MSAVGISIITPAYNAAHCVTDAVESALAQEVSVPFEVIVVDDGSTDTTLTILKQLAERHPGVLRVDRHARNRGGGAARNTAAALARAPLLYLADADNVLPPGTVEAHLRHQRETGLHAVAVEKVRVFAHEDGEVFREWTQHFANGRVELRNLFQTHESPASHGNYLFTRELYEAVGGYEEARGAMESWTYAFKHIVRGMPVGIVPGTSYLHRVMTSGRPSYWQREEAAGTNDVNALATIREYAEVLPPDLREKVAELGDDGPFWALVMEDAFARDVDLASFRRRLRRARRTALVGRLRRLGRAS